MAIETYAEVTDSRSGATCKLSLGLQPSGFEAGVTFGRAAGCTVVLDDPSVAPLHATVFMAGNHQFVKAEHGCEVSAYDGRRKIPPGLPTHRTDGARLRIGHFSIRVFRLRTGDDVDAGSEETCY